MADILLMIGCGSLILLWTIFYPNPFHRKGRFRKPGGWNGKFWKNWHYDE